jgi:hypothetical protein
MRAPLHRASDWIYILLADWQRSPVPVMFEKRFGSPVGFRTYDPQVRSKMIFQCSRSRPFSCSRLCGLLSAWAINSDERSGLFSAAASPRWPHSQHAKALLGSANLVLPPSASAVCSLHIFASATENAWLVVAAVVWAGATCEGSSLACVRSIREIAASPRVLAFPWLQATVLGLRASEDHGEDAKSLSVLLPAVSGSPQANP